MNVLTSALTALLAVLITGYVVVLLIFAFTGCDEVDGRINWRGYAAIVMAAVGIFVVVFMIALDS